MAKPAAPKTAAPKAAATKAAAPSSSPGKAPAVNSNVLVASGPQAGKKGTLMSIQGDADFPYGVVKLASGSYEVVSLGSLTAAK